MDIKEEITKLEKHRNEINESGIPTGTKSDILKIVDLQLEQLTNLLPIYDNIENVRATIVDPTNEKINDIYMSLKKDNKSSRIQNYLLSGISILFGLLGIVLTVFSFIEENTNEGIVNQIINKEEIIDPITFDWLNSIEYTYPTQIIDNLTTFSLKIDYDGFLRISMNTINYNDDINLSDSDLDEINRRVTHYINSYNENNEPVIIELVRHNQRYGNLELVYSISDDENVVVPKLFSENNIVYIITPIKAGTVKVGKELFGKEPLKFINSAVEILSLLKGEKYIIDIEKTLYSNVLILEHTELYYSIFFKPD
ncbi:hypothetical protein [Marispirochaeta aestuarii]|uniref:hypothetical protein n=1 Tax=Marispirochaeta aestuarii TaxID=1963862 RepID=UPI0029C83B43|nr:hypothetical protein [Marispirochaeta aestuarii]